MTTLRWGVLIFTLLVLAFNIWLLVRTDRRLTDFERRVDEEWKNR